MKIVTGNRNIFLVIVLVTGSILFSGCGEPAPHPSVVPLDPGASLGMKENFVLSVTQSDLGQVSKRLIVQHGREFFTSVENDAGVVFYCSSLSKSGACTGAPGVAEDSLRIALQKALSQKIVDVMLRRVLPLSGSDASYYSKPFARINGTTSVLPSTIADLFLKLGNNGARYLSDVTFHLDSCFQRRNDTDQEHEEYCLSGEVMPLYSYTIGEGGAGGTSIKRIFNFYSPFSEANRLVTGDVISGLEKEYAEKLAAQK